MSYEKWLSEAKSLTGKLTIPTNDMLIPSDTSGIELFLRNKRRSGAPASKAILCVHGSSYPAETAYDLPLDGISWMDHLAAQGNDVWLVDVRGYGRSTRPAEMDVAPSLNGPVVRTDVAIRDISTAVNFILQNTGITSINLVGWSWGTTLMGAYTAINNVKVSKLILLAPQWLRTVPSASDMGGTLGAYRTITRDAARSRWFNSIPEPHRRDVVPDSWFDLWADATFATDPWGAAQLPPVVRAPNGTVQDSREFWAAGRPIYDPGQITVPILIVHAEWDQELPIDMTLRYFDQLTRTKHKRWVEVGRGTHSLLLERCRWQVFRAVDSFLSE